MRKIFKRVIFIFLALVTLINTDLSADSIYGYHDTKEDITPIYVTNNNVEITDTKKIDYEQFIELSKPYYQTSPEKGNI